MWPLASLFRVVTQYVSMASSDRIYRSFLSSIKFFTRGWGPMEAYEGLRVHVMPAIMSRDTCQDAIAQHSHPVTANEVSSSNGYVVMNGAFTSPLTTLMPGILPPEAETARFELLLPDNWKESPCPVYIQLAGTGDHYFWRRRRLFGLPLVKSSSIGSLILENPFYGVRKPHNQVRSQLHHLSDLFVMGSALILESIVLGNWLEREGLGPVGLTGISMGGHNASLAASVWPKPVAVVPCLSWATASSVFTDGALTSSVSWDVLEQQLFNCKIGQDERRRELFNTIVEQERMFPSEGPGANLLKREEKEKLSVTREESIAMMRCLMDDFSHLRKFPTPLAPELALFLAAKEDMYIPRENIADVRHLWPGCEVRYVQGGHVSAAVFQQRHIRKALIDAMDRVLYSQSEAQSVASN